MERLELLAVVDEVRRNGDFLSLGETLALRHRGNVVYDPFSTLISRHVQLASGNIFYPNVVLRSDSDSHFSIGGGNVFHSVTFMEALSGGSIVVGGGNMFGTGGFKVSAGGKTARIVIGDHGRYNSGASVYGLSELGSGTQILGLISVTDCVLGAGEDFNYPDPDQRGAVLKGHGPARKLHVAAGEVISCTSSFEQSAVQRQTDFHPKPPAG